MHARRCYILWLCLLAWTMPARAAMTTEGTEFYVTFMTNFEHKENSGGLQLKLLASAQKAATVTITNPQTGWQKSFSVADHGIAEYTIPAAQAYLTGDEKAEKKGLCVTSSAPISLYASNYADATNDATGVLPITALSGYYIIQTYESTQYPKEFAFVATEDNTTVIVTPKARTLSGKPKNTPFTIKLNKGEACQVRSSDEANDLSGTTLQANHAIAVFAGHQCANVAADDDWCDHIVEQTIPVSMWGKHFAVTKTIGQYTNRVQVTAQQDNTTVSVNGMQHVTLNALQTYEFQIDKSDISCYIETSLPAACYLYTEGGRRNNKVGDPSSVYISPVEQFLNEITFATLKTARSEHNYVNIVTPTATANRTMLDGAVINRAFTPLAGNEQLSYVRMEVSHGTHTLSNAEGGLTAYVYGLGDGESYAYMVGSSTYPLDAQILVDGKPGAQTEMEVFCRRHTFTFAPQVNMDYSSVTWDFGDGTTLVQESPQHIYTSAGDYIVTMTVTGETETKTVSTTLHLDEQLHDTIRITLCEGDKYTYHGKDYTTAGRFPVTLISKDGCDSIVVVEITKGETYLIKDTRYLADGQTIRWRGQRIATPGTYRDTLPTVLGCDSIFELTLIRTDAPKVQYDTLCYEPSYLFMGHEYPIPPVDAYKDKEYVNYNLEYRDKESCRKYIMHLAIVPNYEEDSVAYDTIPHGTIYQWRGKAYTESGTYTDDEELGCHSVKHYTLHLVVKPYPIEETEATLCLTGSFDFRGTELTEPGLYSDTVFSAAGIGAVYRVELTDNRSSKELYVEDVPSYDFKGKTLTVSGTYRDTLVNAAGCDSIVTLYLGIDGKCTVTEEINSSLCEGESIVWNLQTCEPGNDYFYKTVSASGCDSIVTLHLHPLVKKEKTITTEICEGDYFRVGEERLSEEDTHVVHLTSAEGCDSVVTVHLTVLDPLTGDTSATFCEGKSFTWHEAEYTTAGDYPYTYVSRVAPYCDSIVTLHLSQVGATDSVETVTICTGETHIWHGKPYTATTTEEETLTNAAGCDSVCTLHLTVLEPLTGDTSATFCEGRSFTWHETGYTTAGDYEYTYTSVVAPYCDSIVTLHLSQVGATDSVETVTICAGETHIWHNRSYTATTTETETLTNAAGCDSVCTLHLQVYDPIQETVLPPVELCFGESYPWLDGTEYTTSQSLRYTLPSVVTGCDSVVRVELTIWSEPGVGHEYLTLPKDGSIIWNGETYTTPGDYEYHTTTIHGCDSTVWLHLSDKPVYDSTEVQTICAGEPILWYEGPLTPTETDNVFTYRIPGTETDTVITLTVTVHPSYPNEEFSDAICEGETYHWEDTDYTEPGEYPKTLQTEHGCDSVVTLHLTVYPTYADPPEEHTMYKNETYEWEGETYRETGTYTKTYESVHGCDSVVTLNLTVIDKPVLKKDSMVTICEGETFLFYDTPYDVTTEQTVLREGRQADTLVTLHLTVLPRVYAQWTDSVLEGKIYTIGDTAIQYAGDYTIVLQTVQGCDSVVSLHLETVQIDKEALSVEVDEPCADVGILEVRFSAFGVANKASFHFDEKARNAGLRDTVVSLGKEGTVTIPFQARAGRYRARVELLFRDQVAHRMDVPFVFLFPSFVIEQHWNDVVAVLTHDYNGGYDFVAFQWYENGNKLTGETRSYLYRQLVMGAEYSAMLTEKDGTRLMCCPIIASPQTEISVYPTVSAPARHVHCYVSEKAQMELCDATGRMIYQCPLESGDNLFPAPDVQGIYIIRVHTAGDRTKVLKLFVQ